MTTKQVAKDEERGVTTQEDNIVGMSGEFGAQDLETPRAYLVQDQSVDKGETGTFYLEGRNYESLDVAVLHIKASRAMWSDDMGIGHPVCSSDNRKTGRTQFLEFITGDTNRLGAEDEDTTDGLSCASCRFSKTADNFEKIDGEQCMYTYELLLADLNNNDEPFVYGVKGGQFKIVRRSIIAQTKTTGRPWTTRYKFTTREMKSPNYYALKVAVLAEFDEDSQALYASMAQMHGKQAAAPADAGKGLGE